MPHPIDLVIGRCIRTRRVETGISQMQLAQKVGVRFQQIQKYETGANRVSASRLWAIAAALDTGVMYFFGEFGTTSIQAGSGRSTEDTDALAGQRVAPGGLIPSDFLADADALKLVCTYYAIPERQRRKLFEFAHLLGTAA